VHVVRFNLVAPKAALALDEDLELIDRVIMRAGIVSRIILRLNPGIDRNAIGQARTISFGINVGF
jgi:hypothetical protein